MCLQGWVCAATAGVVLIDVDSLPSTTPKFAARGTTDEIYAFDALGFDHGLSSCKQHICPAQSATTKASEAQLLVIMLVIRHQRVW
jgi:hypothetical protein